MSVLDNWEVFLSQAEETGDFALKCEGGILKAHRFVLGCQSPVFKKMFEGEWKENSEGKVDLDVEVGAMKNFLKYIYCGKIEEMEFEEIHKLLVLGNRYLVKSLVEKCCSLSVKFLEASNALEMWNLAEANDSKVLLTASAKVLAENINGSVLDGWKKCPSTRLLLEVIEIQDGLFKNASVTKPYETYISLGECREEVKKKFRGVKAVKMYIVVYGEEPGKKYRKVVQVNFSEEN